MNRRGKPVCLPSRIDRTHRSAPTMSDLLMPISDQHDTMDAEIKNLRIDRSAKQRNGSGRNLLRWILLSFGLSVLLGVGVVIYGRLNAAVEVETVRVRAASTSASGASTGATILNATGYIIAAHKI